MPIIKTNDINLYYEIHGSGEPLVLVSGYSLSHLIWNGLIPSLSKHFQVIVFDNRGCGQSDTPEGGYHPKMFAEDIIGLLDALRIDSAHVMGESMGTLIVQRLCLDHRDRVKKAILCAPFAALPAVSLFNLNMIFKLAKKGVDRLTLVELNCWWLFSDEFVSNPDNIKRYLADYQANPFPQSLEGALYQANALNVDFRHELKNIPHAVLLLAGERDIISPLYCAEFMHQEIPNSELHVFKQMGHMFNYEIPETSTKKVIHFLLQK
ncbi:MAG: alpha/beta hydrolase [Verrucomicrobia bacterium]|nr:alpha/beta hydrolase [Verrucomicrobiota bacterium]